MAIYKPSVIFLQLCPPQFGEFQNSTSVEPVLHTLHCSRHLPLNLLQHRCALLKVQRRDCTESSGRGCIKVFYGILISRAFLNNAPCFLGFSAAAAREVIRKLPTQIAGPLHCKGWFSDEHPVNLSLTLWASFISHSSSLAVFTSCFHFTCHVFLGFPMCLAIASLNFSLSHERGGDLCHVFLFMSDILPWLLELYF